MNRSFARRFATGCALYLSGVVALLHADVELDTAVDIGTPSVPGTIVSTPDGVQMTSGGQDIGGNADQCQFYYSTNSGDFDVRVRVKSLEGGDLWAKAGIMVRQTMDAGSPAIAVLGTPNLLGTMMEARLVDSGTSVNWVGFPSAIPSLWLRLQRTNGVFNGYAGVDGQLWYPLNSATYEATGPMLLGLATSAHGSNRVATAKFSDFGAVSNAVVSATRPKAEIPGPTTRKCGLAITEIMYKPAVQADGKNLEFVELFNANPFFEDISGYRLAGSVNYTFPAGTVLPGGGFVVVAKVPGDLKSHYGLSTVLGPYNNKLPANGVVQLQSAAGAVLQEVPYSNTSPWPVGAGGTGHSLVLARPSYGEANPEAWDASFAKDGSPGLPDPPRAGVWNEVVINEFYGGDTSADSGFIELFNRRNEPLDISGSFLSDDPTTNKFQVPAGTTIAGRGFLAFTEKQLGFPLTLGGGTVYFSDPTQTRLIQAVSFGAHAAGTSLGSSPDGSGEYYTLANPTPGTTNSSIKAAEVVINEIMYHPLSENDDDQYIELYNPGSQSVDMGGWKFVAGVDFTFPSGTSIAGNGYLVVARNAARLQTNYDNLNGSNLKGDFQGKLSHNGERLALARPVNVANPLTGLVDIAYTVVDETTYHTGGQWGQWSDGGGSSLELIDARANRRRASSWADSDETKKAPWTSIEKTGTLNNGNPSADSLHVLLLGGGECLVDNVEVRVAGISTNLILNPTFEKGMANWSVLGNHVRTTLETNEGFQSSQCLHVRASDHGDTGANRIRAVLGNANKINNNKNATLRAKVRWLHGSPEFLLRLKGNYMESYTRLEVPKNLGTPGLPNSRAVANAGPSVDAVTHNPVLPAADQPVVVTARVSDPDGVGPVMLYYRIDPALEYTSIPMVDDGAGGDVAAGDGIYSATIPGQPALKTVAFYVMASDRQKTGASTLFPNNAPQRECLVRFGDVNVASPFGTYRLWMTSATVSKWIARPVLSNEELDLTFVYDNQRVVYNASARYSGSPFHQSYSSPIAGVCTYAMSVPADDQVLGTTSFNKLHAPGNNPGDDPTLQCEQTAYWMVRQLGLPWNYQRYFHMYVNGVKRGALMEDTQVPGAEAVKENFPDNSDGNLYKLQVYIEFADAKSGSMSMQAQQAASLDPLYTADGQPDMGAYRWTWAARASHGAANDYTNVVALTQAAGNYGDAFQVAIEPLIDVNQWLRTLAIEHVVGNWDSFGFNNGQNMYAYKPLNDKWRLMIWDFNIVLSNVSADSATTDDILYSSGGYSMYQLIHNPIYQRAYMRELKAIAQGVAMDSAQINARVDARYAAFKASGLTVSQPLSIKNYVTNRRTALMNLISKYDANFQLTGDVKGDFTTNLNWFVLSGVAPVNVETFEINGVAYPVTWTSVSNWSIRLPLNAKVSNLVIRGVDVHGLPVPGAAAALTATYTGPVETSAGHVVINEIMYHPAVDGAEFVEIYNNSSLGAFDLSNYRISGIDYTFPGGTWINPNSYLVLARDKVAFASAYGSDISVAGVYAGHLDNKGETVALIRPGPTPLADVVVDKVTYSSQFPWPQAADGQGASLQLIDPALDHMSPSSWRAVAPSESGQNIWRYVTVTGVATSTSTNLLIYHSPYQAPHAYSDLTGTWKGNLDFTGYYYSMSVDFYKTNQGWAGDYLYEGGSVPLYVTQVSDSQIRFAFPTNYGDVRWEGTLTPDGNTINGTFTEIFQVTNTSLATFSFRRLDDRGNPYGGEVYIDDLQLVAGSVAGVGTNLVRNGAFEDPLVNGWQVASNCAISSIVTNQIHGGAGSLHLVANSGGQDESAAVWQTIDGLTPGQTYTLSFWYRPSTNGTDLTVRLGDSTVASTQHLRPELAATPGSLNAVWIDNRALLPLSLTELMAENTNSIADGQGHRSPWLELYNRGTNAVSLAGCYLANQTTNLLQWAFPADASIQPGQYVIIWLDSAAGETTASEWHANFQAAPVSGMVVLSHKVDDRVTILDELNYQGLGAGQSFGVLANGEKAVQLSPTPWAVNAPPASEVHLVINEWMADNTHTFADTADGQFKDWFELRNLGSQAVDLTGYSLADTLTNQTQFVIPTGYAIPAQGYLLVWADSSPKLNTSAHAGLHVNFKLNKAGDTLALFAPDGSLMDSVIFGRQAADISQGLDGQGAWIFMDTPTPGAPNKVPTVAPEDKFRITDVVLERNGSPMILWTSVPGQTYQVQYNDAGILGTWQNLGDPVVATDDYETGLADHTKSTTGQRFYRVVLVTQP